VSYQNNNSIECHFREGTWYKTANDRKKWVTELCLSYSYLYPNVNQSFKLSLIQKYLHFYKLFLLFLYFFFFFLSFSHISFFNQVKVSEQFSGEENSIFSPAVKPNGL
jgi:hypothetical protein